MRRGELGAALLDLLACIAGFGAAALIDYAWMGDDLLLMTSNPWIPWSMSAVIAWFAMVFPETQWHEGLRLWIDGFFAVVAMNLLVQSGLTYLFDITPASWLVIVLGSAFTMAAAGLIHKWIPPGPNDGRNGVIFVGSGDVPIAQLKAGLNERILGGLVEGGPAALPSGAQFLGSPDHLKEVCERLRPRTIVVSGKRKEPPSPRCCNCITPALTWKAILSFMRVRSSECPGRSSGPPIFCLC